MRVEVLVYVAIVVFCWTFYTAIGKIQTGIKQSLVQTEFTNRRIESVEQKVDDVGNDVVEIKDILKKSGVWRGK